MLDTMIIELVHSPSPRKKHRYVWLLECDQCHKRYEQPTGQNASKKKHHFCERACLDAAHTREGVLKAEIDATMVERYGINYRTEIARRASVTLTPAKCKARAQKAKRTVIERYGANSAVQIPHVREACLKASATPEAHAKRKATTKERFGVESILSLPEVHALCNTPEKCHQRHETMKRNGTYFTSQPENDFYSLLCEKFGLENVERPCIVNKWPIDFYIKSIDTYVQFDGEYWHALDRPLDEIAMFKTPRDKTILRKYEIDREQDAWFGQHGLRLIRITDKQYARGELPNEFC